MKCPAEGCIREIRPAQSFCGYHMMSLPKRLRRALLMSIEGSPRVWATAMIEAKDILLKLDRGNDASA